MVAPAIIAAGIAAAAGLGSAFLNNKGNNKENKTQKTKRHLIDKLLSSLNGNGPYSDLYNVDEDSFNKSFVEPAKARFRNQIAPQIQQSYIASGQQRGTGLDDQLLRAGVDIDQMLNEKYAAYQDAANQRKQHTIDSILGSGNGAPAKTSGSDALAQGAGGFLQSDAFKDLVKEGANYFGGGAPAQKGFNSQATRPGYAPDFNEYSQWKLGDPRWGQ